MWSDITIQDMMANIKLRQNAVIVDVRTETEWRGTGIPTVEGIETFTNTVVYPPEMLPNDDFLADLQDKIKTDTVVYFICRSGKRSQISANIADKNGYKCYNVLGGIMDWIENGYPRMDYEA